jgi:hypothetical protein
MNEMQKNLKLEEEKQYWQDKVIYSYLSYFQ